jgi:cell wall-associated NlpC family hydrolase
VDQFQLGTSVGAEGLLEGDLLFFRTVGEPATSTMPLSSTLAPTHVAIAIGGDRFVHAPSSTGSVRVERLDARYWSARYLGARRVR